MKRNSIISLLLATIWLVSGCQADSTPTTPTEEKAATPSATATIVSTPTEIPISTLSIEEILERLISGEVTFEEINTLDFEQQKVFSIALDAEMDKQRGDVQVTHTDESGKKLYLGEDGKFHPEKQTIDSTLPKVTDKEGYIHVFYKGEWIKIKGSQNIQFNDFENFPWPKTELTDPQILDEKDKHILTTPEWLFRNGSQKNNATYYYLEQRN